MRQKVKFKIHYHKSHSLNSNLIDKHSSIWRVFDLEHSRIINFFKYSEKNVLIEIPTSVDNHLVLRMLTSEQSVNSSMASFYKQIAKYFSIINFCNAINKYPNVPCQ